VQIETRRFGTVTLSDDELFSLPSGIPGFPSLRRMALLGAGAADADMFWLQDVDDGDLAFMCIIPWDVFPEYDLEIDEHELGIDDYHDVRVLNFVTVHRDASEPKLTANLRAPLVLDMRRRRMMQVILSDSRWSVSAPIEQTAAPVTAGVQ